jgi:chromate transporter
MAPSSEDLPKPVNIPGIPPAVSFMEAVGWWLKLGLISFGGPAGQISIMHQELVERRRWISEQRFLHALNYTMVLPGPEAQQLATYIGWLMHGSWGGIVAGSLFVLPSLIILIVLSWLYLSFGEVPAVAAILYGVKPVVTAIVAHAAWRIGKRALRNPTLVILALSSFVAIAVFSAPFPLIVIAAALLGMAGSRLAPGQFRLGAAHGNAARRYGPALIDDDTPAPPHARFSRSRLLMYLCCGILAWLSGIGFLLLIFGAEGTLSQMAWFFSKAALFTFGGAYAVLPYVYQGGVEQYGWLTATQMIDGLALGETTPGPLIMVVAFVGFVGGWSKEIFGPEMLALAGIAGAVIASLFTFLPSFLFILVGGPLVEASRDEIRLTAPLAAITAAVVGVILNLAVFFAWHVLWPQGSQGPFDGYSALIGLAAGIAMFFANAGIMPVLLFGMLAGLAHTFLLPSFI